MLVQEVVDLILEDLVVEEGPFQAVVEAQDLVDRVDQPVEDQVDQEVGQKFGGQAVVEVQEEGAQVVLRSAVLLGLVEAEVDRDFEFL